MKNRLSGSLYGTMFTLVILPMICLGCIITVFCSSQYTKAIHSVVETELENICNMTLAAFDEIYPGDYALEDSGQAVLVKGDKILSGDYQIIDRIKEETGVDLTLFYYDTRILTTIRDENGNRIVGTGSNAVVMQDVYKTQAPKFYHKVDVMGQKYFSYYKPVFNADGSCVGMIFAGKPSSEVEKAIRYSMIPTVLIILGLLFTAGYICYLWTRKTISHIRMIRNFLAAMSDGRFSEKMDPIVIKRSDEIGKMGADIVRMQYSIRNLIEKDALTGLNNRRFGIIKLDETQKSAEKSGMPFSVALGDIDFFKKINDTYGHDCGDVVLREVAALLNRHIAGKGFAIRWGGEEFLLVYTRLPMEQAAECVEALLQDIRALEIPYGEALVRLTMCFGVTEGKPDGKADVFIKAADDKLYYGKRHGRNRVVSRLPEEGEEDGMEDASL